MFTRLRLAVRVLVGLASVSPATSQPCARCAELSTEVARAREEADYWRRREERTADRLLERAGVNGVATAPLPLGDNPAALAMRALNVTEIDSSKKKPVVTAAGPDAMTRGAAH